MCKISLKFGSGPVFFHQQDPDPSNIAPNPKHCSKEELDYDDIGQTTLLQDESDDMIIDYSIGQDNIASRRVG